MLNVRTILNAKINVTKKVFNGVSMSMVRMVLVFALALAGPLSIPLNAYASTGITYYPIPQGIGVAGAMTTGPDGAIWFSNSCPGDSCSSSAHWNVVRMSMSGEVTSYPNEDAINDITTGPDGALWFTETWDNKVGRITMSGVITEYPLVASNSGPAYITAGPDGNIWFANVDTRSIGRLIPTNGEISYYPVGENDGMGSLITGPDGNIWFGKAIGVPPATWYGYVGHFNPSTLFKPEAPTNFTAASPTSTAPVLSWDGGQGITSYNVYANGVLIGTTTSTTYTDNTSAEGNINYYITSVLNGLESDPSNTAAVVYDKTGPTVTYTLTPAANSNGWSNSNTTVSFTCSDTLSGVNSCPSPVTVSGEGANQQVTRTAIDNVGNTSSVTVPISIDKTSPTIVKPRISDHVLLFTGNDTISATTTDGLSGISGGEYFVGADPGPGNGTPMDYANGTVSAVVNVMGTTTYSMRSRDLAGNWSGIVTIRVIVIF